MTRRAGTETDPMYEIAARDYRRVAQSNRQTQFQSLHDRPNSGIFATQAEPLQ